MNTHGYIVVRQNLQDIGTTINIAIKKLRSTEIDEVFRRVVMVLTIKHLKMGGLMIIHGLKKRKSPMVIGIKKPVMKRQKSIPLVLIFKDNQKEHICLH